jgi:hypothetical protein
MAVPAEALAVLDEGEVEQSPVRRVEIAAIPYGEVLTPLLARNAQDHLGVLGVSLIETPLAEPGQAGLDMTTVVLLSAWLCCSS